MTCCRKISACRSNPVSARLTTRLGARHLNRRLHLAHQQKSCERRIPTSPYCQKDVQRSLAYVNFPFLRCPRLQLVSPQIRVLTTLFFFRHSVCLLAWHYHRRASPVLSRKSALCCGRPKEQNLEPPFRAFIAPIDCERKRGGRRREW